MDIDDLYGVALDRFVPERTELAKALRKEGRRDEAAEVAALRKPSVAAWAVNQLIRTQSRAVKDLFDAGDALRGAHERVASGQGDAQELRKATQGERAAVETLVQAAQGLLTSDGHELSPAVIDRVSETLSAAALDPEARARVSEGRLERELRHVGLGFLGEIAVTPKGKAPAPKRKQDQDRKAEAREHERAQALKDARAVEKDARRELERATRAADTAQERRDKAASALEDAERALADAQAQAQAATAAHDQAAQALERMQTQ
ncbi:MAG: hypothetical protein ACXVSL_17665 [Solirubrobacteraceae bacterium]